MKILIVDDDLDRYETLRAHLAGKDPNLEIQHCAVVIDARVATQSRRYDVIVLDVSLPNREGEPPSPQNGLKLLQSISRGRNVLRPGRIIGITGFLEEIDSFRDAFETHCFSIIPAERGKSGWRDRVYDAICFDQDSELSKVSELAPIRVITVHGIRTFGDWQNRLEYLVKTKKTSLVQFYSYKYGFFSALLFVLPIARWAEVQRATKRFRELFAQFPDSQFTIFSHSFGTFIVAHALQNLCTEGSKLPVATVVLSGSVLKSSFDWTFLKNRSVRLVNDCADDDYVLYFSCAAVWGTGMAGRTGFAGFQDELFLNRFIRGGHSSYFEGDAFMERNWLPLLLRDRPTVPLDQRSPNFLKHDILDRLISWMSYLKYLVYAGGGLVALAALFSRF